MASEHSDQTYSSATPYSPDPDSNYSPYSNAAASPPWSAASHNSDTNESQNSLTLPPINNPDVDFARASFFDSLPRLPSPASFFHAEASSSQQEQRPPPSNQQARHRPQPSQYRLSESPDPFDEFVEYTPPQSPENNRERSSSVVDLTNSSSPRMAPVTRKRKSEAEAASIASLSSPPEPASKKRKRSATPRGLSAKAPKAENPDVVDLVGVEDDSQYADFRAKQQAELIKQQREDEANRPVKLAEFQCIICMDNPTDLIVTHCGMFHRLQHIAHC